MGNMRLRYRIPLAVIAIMMVFTLFLGSSYALWNVTETQTGVNRIDTGCFQISFTEQRKAINLANTYPITDEKGLATTPYTFTIQNTCTTDASFTLYLNTLDVTGVKIKDEFIKYSLIEENGSLNVAQKLSASDTNPELSDFAYDKPLLTSYVIGTGNLRGASSEGGTDGESVTYDLRMWIDEKATTEINGQSFEAAVASIAYATTIS